jgi:hypothetical protein
LIEAENCIVRYTTAEAVKRKPMDFAPLALFLPLEPGVQLLPLVTIHEASIADSGGIAMLPT